mgnify:CR=1 FL=1
MIDLTPLAEAIRMQMQPVQRANPTASTIEQLSSYVPEDVTLADLITGWTVVSKSVNENEEIPLSKRRITCGEIAAIASKLTTEKGSLAQARRAWYAWANIPTFSESDPRQATILKTSACELGEIDATLQADQ